MATLCKRGGAKSPGYEIQFFDASGKRLTIYLGGRRYNERTAREVKEVVEELVLCRDNPSLMPRKSTLKRIDEFPEEIRQKLAGAGLVKVAPTYTVAELWDAFLKQKTDVKNSTMTIYGAAHERFFSFFKGGELLADLTSAMMQRWKTYLRTDIARERSRERGLAESTVAGTLTKAKAVFNWAVRIGWIETSPLTGVGRGSFVNPEKDRFILADEYIRLLGCCPCQEWRTILALARYGGLRCPSELLRLRWSDVNWEHSRFYVRSPKTEKHAGMGARVVPLFPEVRVELERLFFQEDSEGLEFVINRYRSADTNLGTQFGRIVQMAGVQPIPRPFDNMRASRSTEIYNEYGAKLEEEWIGHSSKIAKDHYLQVREMDYERAAGKVTNRAALTECVDSEKCVESCGEKLDFPAPQTKFPAVFPAAGSEIDRHGSEVKKSEGAVNP